MHQSRYVFALPVIACAIAMATAILYFQQYLGLLPCPMCVVQRIVFIALGVAFLVATLHNPQRGVRRFYGGVLTLIAAAGAGVSAWHVYLQNLPADQVPECGPGLDYMMEVMPLSKVLSEVFTGSGECSEILWSFLGLSIPAWTFVAFAGLALYSLWIALGQPGGRRASETQTA